MSSLRVCLALLVAVPFITEVPNKAFSMEDNNQSAKWDDLPKELQAKILGGEHMGIKDNANAGFVSKDWHERANDDVEWQKRYETDRQDLGKDLKEGETWKDAYVQSSFWSLKPSFTNQMGCGYEANQNLPWCKFLTRVSSLSDGVAFIKRNEDNGRQVKMLANGLTHEMHVIPSLSDEDFIRFSNEYPKIQFHHSTSVYLSYSAIMEMCSNAGTYDNIKPIVYSQQAGTSIWDNRYPRLCKKINNDMLQGKDGKMLAYKFNVMMPAVDTAEHEAEVEFYIFPPEKS